jgi:hypothetical protein
MKTLSDYPEVLNVQCSYTNKLYGFTRKTPQKYCNFKPQSRTVKDEHAQNNTGREDGI